MDTQPIEDSDRSPVNPGRRLIVNADGFGFGGGATQGILDALRGGLISSVSVNANFREVERVRDLVAAFPRVSIGVHLNPMVGRPCLPAKSVPSLVDSGGFFLGNGFLRRLRRGRIAMEELEAEFLEQVRRVQVLAGDRLTHVDSQANLHLSYFRLFLDVARKSGVARMRNNASVICLKRSGRGAPDQGIRSPTPRMAGSPIPAPADGSCPRGRDADGGPPRHGRVRRRGKQESTGQLDFDTPQPARRHERDLLPSGVSGRDSETMVLLPGGPPARAGNPSGHRPAPGSGSSRSRDRQLSLDLTGARSRVIHDWKMEVYWRLPVVVQEAALSAFARRLDRLYYGGEFEEWCARYRAWDHWTEAETEAWQARELSRVVPLAAQSVAFYREAWRGLDWWGVRKPRDLRLLPRLDKQDIRQNEASLLVEGLDPKSLRMERTSGSTGTALHIYWPKAMLPRWWALTEVLIRNPAGVAQNMPRAMMGGRPVVPGDASAPPYWRFNRRWRQLYLSSYHVGRASAKGYIDAMRKYGSEWITGYGSAIAALADSALAAGVEPMPLRAAIVSGDTLTAVMRSNIETFFRCRCYDTYGQSEGVAMTMECRADACTCFRGSECSRSCGTTDPPRAAERSGRSSRRAS